MKQFVIGAATLIVLLASCATVPQERDDLELLWSDEFEGDELDTSKWSYMYGTGEQFGLVGWGNNELQYYTDRPENIYVRDGKLHIRAKEEEHGGMDYTSARIRSLDKGDWRYGRFEVRAKLPEGQGIWPAVWMMPSHDVYGGWAASGEIDIMELVGHRPDVVHGTLHYGGAWPDNTSSGSSYRLDSGTFSDDFHVFALEWEEGEMRWYVDGEHYQTQTSWYTEGYAFPAPFDQPFHLLLNVAVGGDWPGSPDATTEFPQEMVIDYVRVYQEPGADNTPSDPVAADTTAEEQQVEPSFSPDDLVQLSLPIDFEDEEVDWERSFFGFEGGEVSIVENPAPDDVNSSDTVARMVKHPGEFWGGAFSHIGEAFRFTEDAHTITMHVRSPREDVPVLMKVEQQDGDRTYEITEPTTTSGEWEEMTWDMSEAGFRHEWDLITVIFDFREGGSGDGSEDFTWYFDNLDVDARRNVDDNDRR